MSSKVTMGYYEDFLRGNIFGNHKRARLYGVGGCRLSNRPVSKSIKPKTIFYELLSKDKRFKRLKGNTSWHLSLDRNGQYYKKYTRWKDRMHNSYWYLYSGKKQRRGLIEIPDYDCLTCRVHQRILWVSPDDENKGIGTEVMKALLGIVDEVDALCKAKETYNGKTPSCSYFALALYPNSFVIGNDENGRCYWDLELIEKEKDNIDWTGSSEHKANPNMPDKFMTDETEKALPKDKIRLSMKQLQGFYKGLGFIECPELAFNEWYDWNTGRNHKELAISSRSFTHKRWALLYPESNIGQYREDKDKD